MMIELKALYTAMEAFYCWNCDMNKINFDLTQMILRQGSYIHLLMEGKLCKDVLLSSEQLLEIMPAGVSSHP